jgi:hypothetical protein
MAFMKTEQYESTPNILESEVGLVLKTYTADQTNAETVGTKKIIKAGSVYPTNATGAIGIVFEDDTKRPISVIVAGRVLEKRLPVTVDTTAKTELEKAGIVFVVTEDPVF